MSDLGFTTFQLPSRGILYLDESGKALIPDGQVSIRKMTVHEESILFSQGTQGVERFDIVLKNCCKLPEGCAKAKFTHADLLLTDRVAVMIALRTYTFGPNYTFPYRCTQCGAPNKHKADIIADLNERTPEIIARELERDGKIEAGSFSLVEPVLVKLPDSGFEVGLRFLRGKDEERVLKRAKALKMQSNDPSDSSYIYRLALQLVSVDGQVIDSPAKGEEIIRKLTSKDGAVMRNAMDDRECSIDMRVYPECSSCGNVNERTMPFDLEFFRPTTL